MDPHSFSNLNTDPHLLKKLDPDTNQVNSDPKLGVLVLRLKLMLIMYRYELFLLN
jgi:hypothetical protein